MEDLVKAYVKAKKAEARATEKRRKLAAELADALEHPDEGSKTHTVGDYKVTVKGSLNRRVDWDAFDQVTAQHPPCKTKRELDVKGLHWFKENDKRTYEKYLETITTKPGAVQVSVKE